MATTALQEALTAGELLEADMCSARCLLALGDGPCDCRCSGRWHGALTGAKVPGDAPARAPGPSRAAVREPRASYGQAVQDFSHSRLASLPAYARLRQALSDLGNESDGMRLADWLAAVRDMAATAPYGDMCQQCAAACHREAHDHDPDEFPRPCGAYRLWWPSAAERRGEYVRGRYQCDQGHAWDCSWQVSMAALR